MHFGFSWRRVGDTNTPRITTAHDLFNIHARDVSRRNARWMYEFAIFKFPCFEVGFEFGNTTVTTQHGQHHYSLQTLSNTHLLYNDDDDQEDEEDLYEDVLDDAEYDVRAIKEVAKRTVAACREGEAAAIELAFEFAENQARLEDEEDDFEGGIYLFCCTALLRHAVVNECFYVPPPFLEVLADLIDELRNMGWELREDAVPEEELTDEATISQYMDSYEEEQRLRQLQMEKERAERAETPDGDRLVEGTMAIPGVRITKLAKPGATAMAGDDDDAPSHSSSPSPPPPSSSESKPKPKPKPKRDSPPSSPRTDSKKPARQSVSEILNAGREPKRGGGRRRRR
ncbi:hypothetical protein PPROV_000636300 [Pycnococcus provasolii]|uniref:Uncharacterized protein n=1 Tax=Pycnococcus provasolii TaxID=41880 RepID=A0A830HQ99_9CHLO|nr:hypothetical protein PPROV_000636300 [Pycnococcus provasolii]